MLVSASCKKKYPNKLTMLFLSAQCHTSLMTNPHHVCLCFRPSPRFQPHTYRIHPPPPKCKSAVDLHLWPRFRNPREFTRPGIPAAPRSVTRAVASCELISVPARLSCSYHKVATRSTVLRFLFHGCRFSQVCWTTTAWSHCAPAARRRRRGCARPSSPVSTCCSPRPSTSTRTPRCWSSIPSWSGPAWSRAKTRRPRRPPTSGTWWSFSRTPASRRTSPDTPKLWCAAWSPRRTLPGTSVPYSALNCCKCCTVNGPRPPVSIHGR